MINNGKKELDRKRYNLSLRSLNKPASQYEWLDPVMADGVPIKAREKATEADPNVRLTYNNFQVIQKSKAGYIAQIKRDFAEDIDEAVINKYKEFDNLNHTKSLFKKMFFSNAGWGTTYSLCYLDNNKRVRIKQVNAWSADVEYDNNNEPIKGFIYCKEDDKEIVYEYDFIEVAKWEKSKSGNSHSLIYREIHGFNGIPVIEWQNNDNKQGNAELAVSILDAYDSLMSDNVTENAALRTAYLLMKNLGTLTQEQQEDAKKSGIFQVQGDGEIHFIQKNVNPAFTELLIKELWSSIWIVASSVDPKALGSLSNATAFQIAQMYRLQEEDCKDTELEWGISLEYLDRLLLSYWTGLAQNSVSLYKTESITYDFVRNIPSDVMTYLKDMRQAGGILPQKEIFVKAGYDDAKADELVEIALNEATDNLPDIED